MIGEWSFSMHLDKTPICLQRMPPRLAICTIEIGRESLRSRVATSIATGSSNLD